MDVTITCPLGHECETIKDNKLHRCAWLTEIAGKDPQSEETLHESRCAIAWMPLLQVETAQTNRGQTQALGSFRDEVVGQQVIFNGLLSAKMPHQDEQQVTNKHLIDKIS